MNRDGEFMDKSSLKDLQLIPGIGPALAHELKSIEVSGCSDLVGADPEALYQRLCDYKGAHVDRCVLYAFRCAVYFVSNDEHDPELLKWWNWKDCD